jgi:hypothetical protein
MSDLLRILVDFERLWNVTGLTELLAERMARPPLTRDAKQPCQAILHEHRRLLEQAIGRAQRHGLIAGTADSGDLADALVGFYLSRRLAGGSVGEWAARAISTVARH